MRKNLILFGASRTGDIAYRLLGNDYNILYYCDNDKNKWNQEINNTKVISVEQLKILNDSLDFEIIITSSYFKEIAKQLTSLGIYKYSFFKPTYSFSNTASWDSHIEERTDIPVIDLGHFLSTLEKITIEDVTFLPGGSQVLDYVFLKAIMLKFNFVTFLEIGTWMGESIACVADVAKHCYSVSLPDEKVADYFNLVNNKDNFSRYFSKKKENITHFYADSKTFDYNQIKEDIHLVFIDGDHTYDGIYNDTKKIFNVINRDSAIVIWHDFKAARNKYIMTTVNAILDALPKELHKNLYGVDNNLCGIYIPDRYLSDFKIGYKKNELYSYTIEIGPKKNIL